MWHILLMCLLRLGSFLSHNYLFYLLYIYLPNTPTFKNINILQSINLMANTSEGDTYISNSTVHPQRKIDLQSVRQALLRYVAAEDPDQHIWDVRQEQIMMELDRCHVVELRRAKFIERFICDKMKPLARYACDYAAQIMGSSDFAITHNTDDPNDL